MDKIYEMLKTDDFYHDKHKIIYETMLELHSKSEPLDAFTVGSHLDTKHQLEVIGGLDYLLSLSSEVPTTANSEYYGKIVEEKATLRALLTAAGSISEAVYSGNSEVDGILNEAEQYILDISNKKKRTHFSHIREVLHETFDHLEVLKAQGSETTGVPTFKSLDRYLNGLQKSDMIICAARPGMGKTSFCLNIAQNAAVKEKTPVAIFSLEMSKEQLVLRLLSSQALVDQSKIRQGSVTQEDFESLVSAASILQDAPIFIDDTPGINIMEIRGKARRLKAEHGLGLIIIDYLQLMSSSGTGRKNENRQQEISDISRNVKLLAREMDVPVLALSQLSRAAEQGTDKKPNLSHLRESGSLEQDSDVVLFIYRPSYYDEENEGDKSVEIIIGKHRHGPTGTADLVFLDSFTKFADMETNI